MTRGRHLFHLNCRARRTVCAAALIALLPAGAAQGADIEAGSTYQSSNLGGSVSPNFKGGTLQISSSGTITTDFTVQSHAGNTLDARGQTVTLSGNLTGAGALTFSDTIGGGTVTLTGSGNSYSGITTINNGATLALSGSGILSASSLVTVDGTFDVSQASSPAIVSLAGSGRVLLGAQTLYLSNASSLFSGVIEGTGALNLTAGSQILTGENTYSGGTIITAGTLQIGNGGTTGSIQGNVATAGTLVFNRSDDITFAGTVTGTGGISHAGAGTLTLTGVQGYTGATTISTGTLVLASGVSIASSSGVVVNGTFDISNTGGVAIKSLSGTGSVHLGAQTLTITAATGTFGGTISGSGSLVINGGSQRITGVTSYTGTTTINGGMLQVSASAITFNIVNNGTFAFDNASALAMTGVVSGPGGISQTGQGVTTIHVAQSYSGLTSISAGTLALANSGSIANSSGVALSGGTFDISATPAGATVSTISGTGKVQLGAQTLHIVNGSASFSGVIEGTGGITIEGGSQTLSGTNSFTGVTTISAGTLMIGGPDTLAASSRIVNNANLDISQVSSVSGSSSTTIASLAGNGLVTLGTKTLIIANAADSYAGSIAGSGNLTISSGTQTLTGSNSFTGTALISASGVLALSGAGSIASAGSVTVNGTLDISASAAGSVDIVSLAGLGSVNLGSRTLNITNATTVFNGTIQGSGGLDVKGGNVILAGSNSYTGGTTISAGTLTLGQGTSGGSITGDVVNQGKLAFYRNDTLIFSGAISGGGNVTQSGSGTTILTAAHSYTGGTTIDTGTLQIGNGGTSGSITGNVVNNGTLAFARSDTNTFGGTISSIGNVSIVSGNTILTSVNSYSGDTNISGGATLTLAAGSSISGSRQLNVDGTADLSGLTNARLQSLGGNGAVVLGGNTLTLTNASGNFAGVISGTGGLAVIAGNQTLSGVSTYSGATTLTGGKLTVTGTLANTSSVQIGAGSTLAGTGTVSSLSTLSGGTVAPGVDGSGVLNVAGNASFVNGAVLEISNTESSTTSLDIAGTATLSGTLRVVAADGTYTLGQKWTVLSADGGITGAFTSTSIDTDDAIFSTDLTYDANNVYLEINLEQLSPLLPDTATANQTNVIAGIDAALAAGSEAPLKILNLANSSSGELPDEADAISGELGASVPLAGRALLDPFVDSIFQRLSRDARNGGGARRSVVQTPQVWATAFAGSRLSSGNGSLGSHEAKTTLTGAAAGIDWAASPRLILGAAVSAGRASFDVENSLGSGDSTAVQFAGYGQMLFSSKVYGHFAVAGAINSISTERTVSVSGTDVLTAKVSPILLGGRYEAGARLGWGTPYVALQDVLLFQPAYSEKAHSGSDDFALQYGGGMRNEAALELGVRQNFDLMGDRNWFLSFTDRFGLQQAIGGGSGVETAFINMPASDFTVHGASGGGTSFLFSLGLNLRTRSGLAFDLRLESKVSSKAQTHTGFGNLSFNF